MKKHLLLSLLLVFCLAACKKEKPPKAVLPPETQEGKNTVGFTIDGNVWVPYYKCGFGRDICGEISARVGPPAAAPEGIDFQFARKIGDKSSSLTISAVFTTVSSIGEKIDSISANFRSEESNGNYGNFSTIVAGSQFTVTKFDRQIQVISGTFDLILAEDNQSGRFIKLKGGRFDFQFNHCQCSTR